MSFSPQTYNQVHQAFIANARKIIKLRGMTLAEVAAKAGVSAPVIGNIVSRKGIGLQSMIHVSNGLEVPLSVLLDTTSEAVKEAKESRRAALLAELADLDNEE